MQAEIDSTHANEVAAEWSKNGKIDYTGVNLYIGFKSNLSKAGDAGREKLTDILTRKMDNYKKTYGASAMMITEYGAGANINQHTIIDEDFFLESR